MYFLAICTSEKCLFSSLIHLLIGLFVLLVFNFFEFFIYSVILISYQMNSWQRLSLVIVSFGVQKLFNLMQYHLSTLVIIS
jgi:hypothetical protein